MAHHSRTLTGCLDGAARRCDEAKKRSIPESLLKRFDDLCESSTSAQCEAFLTSFIFELGEDWKVCEVKCRGRNQIYIRMRLSL